MNHLIRMVLFAPLLAVVSFASEPAGEQPWESGAVSLESGLVWQVGTGTPLSYRLAPTQLSWRSAEVFGFELGGGSRLLVRHRFTLMGAWVQQGPESFYLAVAASPSVEWWNEAGTWAVFGGAGGGFGLIDSRGVEGGQGQDFTLNWFARAGVERAISPASSLSAGLMFLHMSNGGQTDPNPGIDALGFTVGYSRKF